MFGHRGQVGPALRHPSRPASGTRGTPSPAQNRLGRRVRRLLRPCRRRGHSPVRPGEPVGFSGSRLRGAARREAEQPAADLPGPPDYEARQGSATPAVRGIASLRRPAGMPSSDAASFAGLEYSSGTATENSTSPAGSMPPSHSTMAHPFTEARGGSRALRAVVRAYRFQDTLGASEQF